MRRSRHRYCSIRVVYEFHRLVMVWENRSKALCHPQLIVHFTGENQELFANVAIFSVL